MLKIKERLKLAEKQYQALLDQFFNKEVELIGDWLNCVINDDDRDYQCLAMYRAEYLIENFLLRKDIDLEKFNKSIRENEEISLNKQIVIIDSAARLNPNETTIELRI